MAERLGDRQRTASRRRAAAGLEQHGAAVTIDGGELPALDLQRRWLSTFVVGGEHAAIDQEHLAAEPGTNAAAELRGVTHYHVRSA